MNILFWNLQEKGTFFDTIVSIVNEEDIDVAFFAEFPNGTGDALTLESKLKTVDNSFSYLQPIANRNIETFSRIRSPFFVYKQDEKRHSIFQINGIINPDQKYNLFVCHLPSKINYSDDALGEKARGFRKRVEEFEEEQDCHNTIICGDFNMNPFEKGMYYAPMLNAVMDKSIARDKKRIVDGETYHYFYNPMWGHLGDNGRSCIPGSYFLSDSTIDKLHWNLLDQVILRPSVIDVFDDSKLKIVCKGASYNLLTPHNRINDSIYSDHLPLKFNIIV